MSTAYSIFSIIYKSSELAKINTFFKATIGVGQVFGLISGSFLYLIGGYRAPFIIFGCLFMVSLPFIILNIPKKFTPFAQTSESHDLEHSNDISGAEEI